MGGPFFCFHLSLALQADRKKKKKKKKGEKSYVFSVFFEEN
jgi:hypothetical protein